MRHSFSGPDNLCPVYFEDEIYPVSLPFADFEAYQIRLAETRQPVDPVLLRQLIDFVPSLEGKALIDVGSFTGLQASILARILVPHSVYLFEPQKVMAAAIRKTIEANGLSETAVFSQDVIGEDGQAIHIGATRPDRLADTSYLRRATGSMTARSIDSLGLSDVGLVNLDYNDSKIPALRGMAATIEASRPVIVVDLGGRDIKEIDAFLSERGYTMQRAGRYSAIFLPA